MARNKAAAAALDFFIWGTGHAYLGFRKALGIPWVVWTLIVGIFTIIVGLVAANLYYIDPNTGALGYNYGAYAAIVLIPYLIVGGLLIFDLMRRGAISAPSRLAQMIPQAAAQRQVQVAAGGTSISACPSCGTSVTPDELFCPSCGRNLRMAVSSPSSLATPSQAATGSMPAPVAAGGGKVCNSCGTANPAGYNFCKRCGARLT